MRDNELGQLRDQSDMDTVFRVQAKKYFMTYAGLTETELNDFPQIMALVQGWKPNNPIKQYIISREKHQHPADPLREWHIHLFVQFHQFRLFRLYRQFHQFLVHQFRLFRQ